MPLWFDRLLHPTAKRSPPEQQRLIAGLTVASTSALVLSACLGRHVHPAVYEAKRPEGPYMVEVPVTADRYLVADVGIGDLTRPFLVDTGASMSLLDDDVAAALGLASIGETRIVDFEGARRDVKVVRLASLSLGGLQLADVGMAVTDLDWHADAECKPIAGVLGNNVLSGAIELDVGAGALRLASSADRFAPRPGGVTAMAYPPTYNVNLPPFVATLVPHPVVIDTGSPMAITVARAVERKLRPGPALTVQSTVGGVNSSRMATRSLFAWSAAPIAGLDLEGVATIGGAGSTTIGLGVLRGYVVRVDREARTLTFWPGRGPTRGMASMGFGVERAEAGARVSWLVDGSPASTAGLRFGDVIVAVDGAPLAAMEVGARCVAIRDLHRRERARLGVRRGEVVVEIEVERRELLPPASPAPSRP